MFVETIETLSTGLGAVEISKSLFPTFKKLYKRIKEGEINIVIFGSGGCGKSTLGQLLSGQRDEMSLIASYQESITTETYKLENNTIGVILVAPGQQRRQDSWGDLLQNLSVGKFKLIIHVVSGGFHSFGEGIPYQRHAVYQSGMSVEQFVNAYRQDCLKKEINVLKKLIPHLSIAQQKKVMMLTLVTKQDLWWNQRNEIKNYYEQGEYARLIQEIIDQKGRQNFIHEYASASLVMENLVSGAKELLIPTTAGYDQPLRMVNIKNMLNIIEQLSGINL